MGQSTDGILVYGWNLSDEADRDLDTSWATDFLEELEDRDNKDEFLAEGLGIILPDDYPERRTVIEGITLDVVNHCSIDYPMYLLTHRALSFRVYRGWLKDVDILKVTDWPKHDAQLWAAVRTLGLEPPMGPKLLMASYMG